MINEPISVAEIKEFLGVKSPVTKFEGGKVFLYPFDAEPIGKFDSIKLEANSVEAVAHFTGYEVPSYWSEFMASELARQIALNEDKKFFGTITDEDRARYKEQERRQNIWYRKAWRAITWRYNWLINLRIHDQRNCYQEDDY